MKSTVIPLSSQFARLSRIRNWLCFQQFDLCQLLDNRTNLIAFVPVRRAYIWQLETRFQKWSSTDNVQTQCTSEVGGSAKKKHEVVEGGRTPDSCRRTSNMKQRTEILHRNRARRRTVRTATTFAPNFDEEVPDDVLLHDPAFLRLLIHLLKLGVPVALWIAFRRR